MYSKGEQKNINEFKKKINQINLKILPSYWGYLATGKDILAIESEISTHLPLDYQNFMMSYNDFNPSIDGGYCFDIQWKISQDNRLRNYAKTGGFEAWLIIHPEPPLINTGGFQQTIANLNDGLNTYKEQGSERIPLDTIPIANCEDGDLLIIGIGKENFGYIFYWVMSLEDEPGNPTYDNIGFVASSFTEFLELLYPCE